MTLITDQTSTPFIWSLRRCGELEAEVEDASPTTYMRMTCDCGATLARRVESGLEGNRWHASHAGPPCSPRFTYSPRLRRPTPSARGCCAGESVGPV